MKLWVIFDILWKCISRRQWRINNLLVMW